MYTCRARVREKSAIPKAFSTDVPTSSAISYCVQPYIHTNIRMHLHRTYTPPISTCEHISSHLHTLTHTYTYTHFRISPHSTLKSKVESRHARREHHTPTARTSRAPHLTLESSVDTHTYIHIHIFPYNTTLDTQIQSRKHLRSPVLKVGFRHPTKTGRKRTNRRRAKQGVKSHSYLT